jgi:adenosine deaminase
MAFSVDDGITELHSHLGSGVYASALWELAHEQGIKLPVADFLAFEKLISTTPDDVSDYHEYLKKFDYTELVQSSPLGVERSILTMVSRGFRKARVTRHELRFNPMLRNRGGERDLDHIILAAIHAAEKAELMYPVKVGIILMMDRKRFTLAQNEVILKKAAKYKHRGIVGIDIAGPYSDAFHFEDYAAVYEHARKSGLGTTIHVDEAEDNKTETVLDHLKPARIGHGVRAYKNPDHMALLRDAGVHLELCPSSNLSTRAVKNLAEFGKAVRAFLDFGVKFSINTDGPEMLGTSLAQERQMLLDAKILSEDELAETEKWARQASFIK